METIVNVSSSAVWVEKDKDDVATYSFDVAGLLPAGATLATADWVVANGAVAVVTSSLQGNKALVQVSGGVQNAWSALRCRLGFVGGDTTDFVVQVFVRQDAESVPALGSALFPNRFTAIASIRADRLAVAAAGILPSVEVSDDYIWEKLIAAEAEIARELRVYLQPTKIVPDDAPQSEIDALIAAGEPWAQEAAYDYHSSFFSYERWGYLVLQNNPIVSVDSIKFAYPSTDSQMFDVPRDWMRLDKRKGHVNIVPTSVGFALPVSGFVLAFLGGSHVPFLIQARYTAGLVNAATKWPDLVDVVKRMAVLGIVSDAYLPASGSISADGLSQSVSVDMDKYRDTIDAKINGPKGSNGGLRTAIHGITVGVLGG